MVFQARLGNLANHRQPLSAIANMINKLTIPIALLEPPKWRSHPTSSFASTKTLTTGAKHHTGISDGEKRQWGALNHRGKHNASCLLTTRLPVCYAQNATVCPPSHTSTRETMLSTCELAMQRNWPPEWQSLTDKPPSNGASFANSIVVMIRASTAFGTSIENGETI